MKNGFNLTISERAKLNKEEIWKQSFNIKAFYEDEKYIIIRKDSGFFSSSRDISDCYDIFCRENGEMRLSDARLLRYLNSEYIRKRGEIVRSDRKGYTGYKNIKTLRHSYVDNPLKDVPDNLKN